MTVDPLEALHADHVVFRDRFAAVERRLDLIVNSSGTRAGTLQELESDLSFMREHLLPHFQVEEAGILPAVERRAGRYGDSMVDLLIQEHRELERAVTKFSEALVEALKDPGERAIAEVNRHGLFFLQVLQDHVRKEETGFFPRARAVLLEEDWRAIESGRR